MSKTNKGNKGSGSEYWSRRYGSDNFKLSKPSSENKRIINRAERRISKQNVKTDS